MNRRNVLQGLAVGGGIGAALPAVAAMAGGGEGVPAGALADLLALLARKQADFDGPDWRLQGPDEKAEAQMMLMQCLQHAIECRLSVNPDRPVFKRYTTPEKKLLGDNPDALYYTARLNPAASYRITGNVAGATYTSFTVERTRSAGDGMGGLGATLNDTEFSVDAAGDFTVIASAEKPASGDWLPLAADAESITTRHYFETVDSMAAKRGFDIPLIIEPMTDAKAAVRLTAADMKARLSDVVNWLDHNVAPPSQDSSPRWVSRVPNQFPAPKLDSSNTAVSLAAKDNVYAMAPFVLRPDQALVIRGRFPKCRFASLVLWNRFMQTLDYTASQTSLNRAQTVLEDDGSFRMIVSPSDPGVANWLDTGGRHVGVMFWRFQLPEEAIAPLQTELVQLSTLHY